MKSLVLIALVCISGILAGVVEKGLLSETDYLIDEINSKQTTWKAGRNFDPNTPRSTIRSLMGVNKKMAPKSGVKRIHHVKDEDIPESFDARDNWPECNTIKRISDQSSCGSCWAVSAADAMSDRYCISSKGEQQPSISSANIMSCCSECGYGCEGGYPIIAWDYWVETGIVTGGAYNSTDGCQNYPFLSCEHHGAPGTKPACPSALFDTPVCSNECDNGDVSYGDSITYGSDAYMVEFDEEQIQLEILKNGPVVADYIVYEDFLYYKSGVYQYVAGEADGGHAVRMIGWGVENGVKYWLIANSWNDDWGENGTFKIIRGNNECGIEDEVSAGLPKV